MIGGGPAGALTALQLARAGLAVTLVERRARGATKTCGGCLAPLGVRILADLGLRPPMRTMAPDATVRFHHPCGDTIAAAYDDRHGPPAAVVERGAFDRWLIDAAAEAGVEVLQPASAVLGSSAAGGRVELVVRSAGGRRRRCARLVIGADGIGSAVARRLGLVDRRTAGRKYGFAADLAAPPSTSAAAVPDRIASGIDMYLGPDGYVGAVRPSAGILHVGGLVGGRGPSRDPRRFFGRMQAAHPGLGDAPPLPARGPIVAAGPMPWRPSAVTAPLGALVGDAAGYVEPLTGEGMSWALRSAVLLARTLVEVGCDRWAAVGAPRYAAEHAAAVRSAHRLCGLVTASVARPRVGTLLFRAAARHPELVRPIVRRVLAA